jgi:hypothetical protein
MHGVSPTMITFRRASAAVAAGGALLTAILAGATGAGAAATAPRTAARPPIDTSSQGGYVAGGRWFRFVATTVTVPAPGLYPRYAEVVLGGTAVSPVTLAVKAGGGPTSVGWSVGVPPFGMGGGVLSKVSPGVGDKLLIDLYYNRSGGGVVATADDLTSGHSQSFTIGEGTRAVFTAAEVAGVLFHNPGSPSGDIRLWQFTSSAATTYSGVHGTMTGPWTTSTVVDTTNGHASGQVVMSPSFLFGRGADFGAWLRKFLR